MYINQSSFFPFIFNVFISDVGSSSDPCITNGNQWTNYPLMAGINHSTTDPTTTTSNGMIDDNSLDTF